MDSKTNNFSQKLANLSKSRKILLLIGSLAGALCISLGIVYFSGKSKTSGPGGLKGEELTEIPNKPEDPQVTLIKKAQVFFGDQGFCFKLSNKDFFKDFSSLPIEKVNELSLKLGDSNIFLVYAHAFNILSRFAEKAMNIPCSSSRVLAMDLEKIEHFFYDKNSAPLFLEYYLTYPTETNNIILNKIYQRIPGSHFEALLGDLTKYFNAYVGSLTKFEIAVKAFQDIGIPGGAVEKLNTVIERKRSELSGRSSGGSPGFQPIANTNQFQRVVAPGSSIPVSIKTLNRVTNRPRPDIFGLQAASNLTLEEQDTFDNFVSKCSSQSQRFIAKALSGCSAVKNRVVSLYPQPKANTNQPQRVPSVPVPTPFSPGTYIFSHESTDNGFIKMKTAFDKFVSECTSKPKNLIVKGFSKATQPVVNFLASSRNLAVTTYYGTKGYISHFYSQRKSEIVAVKASTVNRGNQFIGQVSGFYTQSKNNMGIARNGVYSFSVEAKGFVKKGISHSKKTIANLDTKGRAGLAASVNFYYSIPEKSKNLIRGAISGAKAVTWGLAGSAATRYNEIRDRSYAWMIENCKDMDILTATETALFPGLEAYVDPFYELPIDEANEPSNEAADVPLGQVPKPKSSGWTLMMWEFFTLPYKYLYPDTKVSKPVQVENLSSVDEESKLFGENKKTEELRVEEIDSENDEYSPDENNEADRSLVNPPITEQEEVENISSNDDENDEELSKTEEVENIPSNDEELSDTSDPDKSL